MELKFEVKGQRLNAFMPVVLLSNSVGYITAKLTFSDEWALLDQWFHLRDEEGRTFEAELVEDRVANLDLASGRWEAWVHGCEKTDGVPRVRIVTNTVSFTVIRAGAVNGILPDIPLSAQEQIASNAANALSEVRSLRDDMKHLAGSASRAEGFAEVARIEAEKSREKASHAMIHAADAKESRIAAEAAAVEAKKWAEVSAEGGVTSFNGRHGVVLPQAGDYTPEMVGAAALGSDGKVPVHQLPTAQAMGAEPAGSCAAVEQKLAAHRNDRSNPHGVTPDQIGAQRTLRGTPGQFVGFNVSGNAEPQGMPASVIVGTYVGDKSAASQSNSLRKIDLGVTPKAVLVAANGQFSGTREVSRAIATEHFEVKTRKGDVILKIEENGFLVGHNGNDVFMNYEGTTYAYAAFL